MVHETHEMSRYLEEHPCVQAWRGYEVALLDYGMKCAERIRQIVDQDEEGFVLPVFFQDSFFDDALSDNMDLATSGEYSMDKPPWIGNWRLHFTHKQYLVTANPERYPTDVQDIAEGAQLEFSWGARVFFGA